MFVIGDSFVLITGAFPVIGDALFVIGDALLLLASLFPSLPTCPLEHVPDRGQLVVIGDTCSAIGDTFSVIGDLFVKIGVMIYDIDDQFSESPLVSAATPLRSYVLKTLLRREACSSQHFCSYCNFRRVGFYCNYFVFAQSCQRMLIHECVCKQK